MKLRPKILLLVIGVLILGFATVSLPLYWYTRKALEEELNKRLISIGTLAAGQLDRELVALLWQEPALAGIQNRVRQELLRLQPEDIAGMALTSGTGAVLSSTQTPDNERLLPTLPGVLTAPASRRPEPFISEIYRLPDGSHLKTVSIPLYDQDRLLGHLVVWGDAEFVQVIGQLAGSIFWIVLIALLLGLGLAVIFSRSLITPVRELSRYARAIQKNINTDPVNLDRQDEFGDLNRALIDMQSEIRENERRNTQLLSGIAHEIKNPLGGIEIYTGLLEEELQAVPEHKTYLQKISTELQHLKKILQEYLEYSRPPRSIPEKLVITAVLEDAFRILLPEMKQNNITYSITGAGIVTGDRSKFRRVFVNLLTNSLQALGNGGRIRVTLETRPDTVGIVVSDNGEGIPAENLDRIFEPHFTTRTRGAGLGLAIVRNIIHEMNGTIFATSTPGTGTAMIITLPRP